MASRSAKAFRSGAELRGMEDLKKELVGLPDRVVKNVLRTAIFRGAQAVRDAAKALAPRDTGALAKSIKARRSQALPGQVAAKVEAHEWYANLVERGHMVKRGARPTTKAGREADTRTVIAHIPARPFMVPALEQNRENVLNAIQMGLQAEIDKRRKA